MAYNSRYFARGFFPRYFQTIPIAQPTDAHIGGDGGSGPTYEKSKNVQRVHHHVYPGVEYQQEQARKRNQQDQIVIEFVVNFTLQHLSD